MSICILIILNLLFKIMYRDLLSSVRALGICLNVGLVFNFSCFMNKRCSTTTGNILFYGEIAGSANSLFCLVHAMIVWICRLLSNTIFHKLPRFHEFNASVDNLLLLEKDSNLGAHLSNQPRFTNFHTRYL